MSIALDVPSGLNLHKPFRNKVVERSGRFGILLAEYPPTPGIQEETLSDLSLGDEQRTENDRRRRPTPMLSRYSFFGRRFGCRRTGEAANAYVDRYGNMMLGILVAIFFLCRLDAIFTLLYIQRGGAELNPVMRAAIDAGVIPFFLLKCGLTLPGIVFLCIHKNFRHVRAILVGVLLVYTALFGYHLYLAALI